MAKLLNFQPETKLSLDDLEPNSFVIITVKDRMSITYYTGMVSYVSSSFVGFNRASSIRVYKRDNSHYMSNIMNNFSIDRAFITNVESTGFRGFMEV